MHQVSSTSRSFSLSWPPPEYPNGIILDYEIRYYDKVLWMMMDVGAIIPAVGRNSSQDSITGDETVGVGVCFNQVRHFVPGLLVKKSLKKKK